MLSLLIVSVVKGAFYIFCSLKQIVIHSCFIGLQCWVVHLWNSFFYSGQCLLKDYNIATRTASKDLAAMFFC